MRLPPIDPPHHDTGPVPHLRRPARETIPHTTHDKAALYLVIAPHISALADELWALTMKSSGLAADPQVIAFAARLLREAQRLLRGEPGAGHIGLVFAPPMLLHALALGMRQLARAVAGFRTRYYGHNPLTGGDAWAVCDAFGNPDPRWLGPRATTSLDGEISDLNLMTAEIIRTHLLRLAGHSKTPLPPNLQRPNPEDDPEAAAAKPPEPPPTPTSTTRYDNRRRQVRLVRQTVRRTLPAAPRT
jgi:hypothetical protein